jgi:hypothetical protein
MHGLHVRTATDQLTLLATRLVQQDGKLSAEASVIERSPLLLDHALQNG